MFDIGSITHVAMAVDDLDAARARLGADLGLTWAVPTGRVMSVLVDGDIREIPIRFTYSREGPPHLELIEGPPGTIWGPADGLHHVGVWTDDLAGDADRLEQSGLSVEMAGVSRSGRTPSGFTYHRSLHGVRLELVDDASRPAFARWLAGGELA